MVKNPLCSAGDVSLIPIWETKTLHTAEELSPLAATADPTHHN